MQLELAGEVPLASGSKLGDDPICSPIRATLHQGASISFLNDQRTGFPLQAKRIRGEGGENRHLRGKVDKKTWDLEEQWGERAWPLLFFYEYNV